MIANACQAFAPGGRGVDGRSGEPYQSRNVTISSATRPARRETISAGAHAPHAACAFAASSVLRSSIAIVIGPTPPGTGVISAARSAAAAKSTSPTRPALGAVDADVDHVGALLDPVALHELGPPDGGDEDVGAAADRGEVARARVAGGDGRVGGQQQRGDRLADEVRAADHDGLGALERDVVAAQQLHHAARRARPQAGAALGQQPGRDRREPVDVLGRRRSARSARRRRPAAGSGAGAGCPTPPGRR